MILNPGTSFEISSEILQRYQVSDENIERIKLLSDYDLSFVTYALSDDLIRSGRAYSCEQAYPLMFEFGKCDTRLVQRLETEFKRFCVLTLLKTGVPHAPPGAVDMYWHFFILHTKEYANFCVSVWGDFDGDPRIRDHFPSTDSTRKGMLDAYRATRALYVDVFGEPELFPMEGIKRSGGDVLPLASREIWRHASDTSGDSYSGTVEVDSYVAQ